MFPIQWRTAPASTNTSAITYLRVGRFAELFTGDAQTESERILMNERAGSLRANVLKVGHHGSCNATATGLLGNVAPQYALISAATPNDLGHPHCQTIAKLKKQGVHWLRAYSYGGVDVRDRRPRVRNHEYARRPGRCAPSPRLHAAQRFLTATPRWLIAVPR